MMERVPTKRQPRLLEAVIQEMQEQLAEGLPWLRHVFGKAERTQHRVNGNKFYEPSVYVGGGKYESVVPDSRDWGNYAFFYTEEEQKVEWQRLSMPYYRVEGVVNLVVWCDTRDMEAEDDRNVESVKWMVMQVLGGMRLKSGRVKLEAVHERDRVVFENYSFREEVGEYMMWPYVAFRFEMRAWCDTGCEV